MPPEATGISFRNDLTNREDFNIYRYRNFYNGGGVAIGDVNGDSLPDVYLTANMGLNRLYLNRGEFNFEDVTDAAGVGGAHGWCTGVAMADVNSDGRLDIYVSNSGKDPGDTRANELFVNLGTDEDGVPRFADKAMEYGLDDRGLSTHAAFFDYDRDGDLDVYLLNNVFTAIGTFNLSKNLRPIRDSLGGDKLLRNMLVEGGQLHFEDVSEEAGIYGSEIGFGLGVTVGDIDLDGWPDVYVSNDFFERDYLYVNQRDGTFEEVLTDRMRSISNASMGADMADLNGDGYPEIFVTEMLPPSERRLKLNTTFESWDRYQNKLRNDYYHQFTRNMLHVNRGDGSFAEVGRASAVEASDWSWGALLVDVDTDGDRDIYVANGIYQDLTNQDYIQFLSSSQTKARVTASGKVDFELLVDLIPSEPVANVLFVNNGPGQAFSRDTSLGLAQAGFSNGAAYGDLDLDGDLDLVVNNVNDLAWVYRNDLPRDSTRQSLSVGLKAAAPNTYATGAYVAAFVGDRVYSGEQIPTRGFQSSVEPRVFLGLGEVAVVDSLLIFWPSGKTTAHYAIPAGRLDVDERDHADAGRSLRATLDPGRLATVAAYREVAPEEIGLDYRHEETTYADWDREGLLFQMTSTMGPCLAVGDVDGDGRDDLFVGGAGDQPGRLYRQRRPGRFTEATPPSVLADAKYEDADALLVDTDRDGDLDLVVTSGTSEYAPEQLRSRDRLYLNDGRGGFAAAGRSVWPVVSAITSCVAAGDFDGDVDLFTGGRQRFRLYGVPAASHLYRNEEGTFTAIGGGLLDTLGLVTDALAVDIDADGRDELVLAREWDRPLVCTFDGGQLRPLPGSDNLPSGWWSHVRAADLDGDGDLDLVLGNHGLNSRFRASEKEPVELVVNDFDDNGTAEQIVTRYLDGAAYPINLRHDLVRQLPSLKKKFLRYDSYHSKTVEQIFEPKQLERAYRRSVTELRSGWAENDGRGAFSFQPFGAEAQTSPIYASVQLPNDRGEEASAILLGGNLYAVKPEIGRYDASQGAVVSLHAAGTTTVPAAELGLRLTGEIRDLATLTIGGHPAVAVARNDAPLQIFLTGNAPR